VLGILSVFEFVLVWNDKNGKCDGELLTTLLVKHSLGSTSDTIECNCGEYSIG